VQIVADELHVPPEEIHVKTGDTDSVGHTDNTGGSRVTYTTGAAVHSACLAAIQILKERAAEKLEVTPDVIDFVDGVFIARDIPDRSIDYKQLARQSSAGGGAISVVGTVTGLPPAPAFAVHVAEVEVDTETGKVDVLRYTAFQDVGKAIHRDGAIGQIQGGVGQGIGWGIHESYVWGEDGTLLNASLLDYRLPTALDVPPIEVVLIEVPAAGGPYGVRGAGEVPIIPPPGTLGNAVYDATGVRMDQLPMSPENVRSRLMSAGDDTVRTRWLSADVSASVDNGRGAVAGVDAPNDE
jgi:CO/xanthine dehydrogenase Mo-binding subunit